MNTFWEHLGVTSICKKLRAIHLKWIGHVQHRPTIAWEKIVYRLMAHQGKRPAKDNTTRSYSNRFT